MAENQFSLPQVIAIVFVAGFATQQVLQILDPLVMAGIGKFKNSRPTNDLPGGMSVSDFKKAIVASLSFVFGLIIVGLSGVRLLWYIDPNLGDTPADFVVSAFVIGTGTEAVNTVIKFMGYVKDAQKPVIETVVSIMPSTVTVEKGATFKFHVDVKNSASNEVDWQVLHGNGGEITKNGLYTAPAVGGSYQIMATSKADPTKYSIATVTVTS